MVSHAAIRFNLVLGTVKPQIEICRLILAKSLRWLWEVCSPSLLGGVENLGDPLWSSGLGNFHCGNCLGAPAETRCWEQSGSSRCRKRGCSQLSPTRLEARIYHRRGAGLSRPPGARPAAAACPLPWPLAHPAFSEGLLVVEQILHSSLSYSRQGLAWS